MHRLMNTFTGLSRTIDRLNEKIAGAVSWALLVAVVICAVNALVRYSLNYSSNAWLEIQWYLYSAVFLLASAYTLRRDEHVRIDVIVGRFSKRTQVWIDLFGYFIFLLPVCLLILWHGTQFAQLSFTSQEMSSNAGGLIVWPAKILLPIAFFLLILQGASEIIKRIAFLAGASDGSDFAKHVTTPQDEIAAIKAANKID
jgi:TRAP-type mannitol/chloroaromatic compound transport system permease small subunit